MTSRRDFLTRSALAMGATLMPGLGRVVARAQAIPAANTTGSLMDVEHIVILMQENRSFDHYFGALAGVRGFADPHPAPLGAGRTVWHQPDGKGGIASPFRFDVENTSFPVMKSLPHDYQSGQKAWNQGRYDQWQAAKGPLTMGYLERADVPFHYALADAFTLCDGYFSSYHGSTCPNRLYMLTGSNDPFARGGGPVLANTNITQVPQGADIYQPGWVTYAERLQAAGIDWRAYRQGVDPYSDDDSDGGMNLLLAFQRFIDAKPGDPLHDRGVAPRRLDQLKADVLANRLPQVSWLFPPRLFCEHPKWPPAYGAAYIGRVLDALTANPEVWSKTVFLVTYDENDGFFDHVVPPTAAWDASQGLSTVDVAGEFNPLDQTPYGLGPRVPMLAISPWSRGGFVCSEVFDHTSLLRFVEARFGVTADGITPWRRTVCGDLTSAFDFKTPNRAVPSSVPRYDANTQMTSNAQFQAYRTATLAKPAPKPTAGLPLPKAESGPRPVRPLRYDFVVRERMSREAIELVFENAGPIGAHFQVYDLMRPETAPRRYTVGGGGRLEDRWPALGGAYAIAVHGPNGFLRRYEGRTRDPLQVEIEGQGARQGLVILTTQQLRRIQLVNLYTETADLIRLAAGKPHRIEFERAAQVGWYGFEMRSNGFVRRYAGQLNPSAGGRSDPLLAS